MAKYKTMQTAVLVRSLLFAATVLFALGIEAVRHPAAQETSGIHVSQDDQEIRISTSAIEAVIRKQGYVSGVYKGSFLDKGTGFRDVGFGLDVVDWLMEPGSEKAHPTTANPAFTGHGSYLTDGSIPWRNVEGPQICTKAKKVSTEVVEGKDFVTVKEKFRYYLAAPGKKPGSLWTQTIVFPAGKRYFISSDRIETVNSSDGLFLRIDMPGHIIHHHGDTFSEVYLSYFGDQYGIIPASEFLGDFPPSEKFIYSRGQGDIPTRFIRAYHLRDPRTGRNGPWLAGMTLDPKVVYQAWCHERGYVCLIEEVGGRPVRPGDSFSAAYIVGFFDSIQEMNEVYDKYAGAIGLEVDKHGWRLVNRSR